MTGTKGKCFVERRVLVVRPPFLPQKRGEQAGELTEAAAAASAVVCNHHHGGVVGVGAVVALAAVIAASVAASLPL